MVPNGITHQVVTDDTEGVGAILDWLCLWLQIRHIDFTRWSQRKTDGQTDRQTDRQTERERERYGCAQIQVYAERVRWMADSLEMTSS